MLLKFYCILLKDKRRHIKKCQEFIQAKIDLNWAASNPADRRTFIGRREWAQGSYTRQKSRLVIAKSLSSRGWQRSVDYLTSADQVIPD